MYQCFILFYKNKKQEVFLFCCAWDKTLEFVHARQVLYHWAIVLAPLYSFLRLNSIPFNYLYLCLSFYTSIYLTICLSIHLLLIFGLFPSLGYYEWCCCEHLCSSTCLNTCFQFGIYLGAELHSHMVILCLASWENANWFPVAHVPF